MPRRLALALVLTVSIASLALAACGDNNGSNGTPTAGTPSSPPTETASTPATGPTSGVPELGQEPIFWRVCEGFPAIEAGAPCKIVFRVTNGYNEDSLPVQATISTTEVIEFEAMRVAPAGGDDKGTFYAITIELPRDGSWQITATAGLDAVTLDVDVSAAAIAP